MLYNINDNFPYYQYILKEKRNSGQVTLLSTLSVTRRSRASNHEFRRIHYLYVLVRCHIHGQSNSFYDFFFRIYFETEVHKGMHINVIII